MGEVVELQARFGWKKSSLNRYSVSLLGRRRSNMANMTAVKKRPKGGESQSTETTESKLESTDSIKTGPSNLTTAPTGAVASKAATVQAPAVLVPAEEEQVLVVREYVSRAAQILQSLGPEYERVAWLLEDTLSYLEEVDEEEESAFERIKIEEL